jgi:hypothetical protein
MPQCFVEVSLFDEPAAVEVRQRARDPRRTVNAPRREPQSSTTPLEERRKPRFEAMGRIEGIRR